MRVTETVSADAALQYASRILNDRDRARDVVQETFVELQRRQRWQLYHAPAKWLLTGCRNLVPNICRRKNE